MKTVDFIEYFKIISEILKKTRNQELSTKLFKVLIITGSIQNILIAYKFNSAEYSFNECTITLDKQGITCSEGLKKMFKSRNKIAHVNDLISVMEIFNNVDMHKIDKEFETVIQIIEVLNPLDFSKIQNNVTSTEDVKKLDLF